MNAPRLCRLDDIPPRGSKGFNLSLDGEALNLFVVRLGQAVYGYRNRCPHVGVELNWQPDTFLSFDERDIQCSVHGAMFRIQDGHCLSGPCVGRSLEPLAVEVEDGWVILKP